MDNYTYPNTKRYCFECMASKYGQCPGNCDDMWERGYHIREGLGDCFVDKYCFDCNEFEPIVEEMSHTYGYCKVNGEKVFAYHPCMIKI